MKSTMLSLLIPSLFSSFFSLRAVADAPSAAQQEVFDAILDGTLDDIEDLPSYIAWPTGAYRVLLKEGFKQKIINDKPAYTLKLVNLEVLEIANAAEAGEAPKEQDETEVKFGLDTETGRGFFKEAIKPFIEFLQLSATQPGAVRAAVDASKGVEAVVIMKRRAVTKDGETKLYPTLVKLEIL